MQHVAMLTADTILTIHKLVGNAFSSTAMRMDISCSFLESLSAKVTSRLCLKLLNASKRPGGTCSR